ncbi:hypothetical protein CPB85DRAFT_675239 [Mucidula mucida]|nr:hypothetical protein CPB85DRAFT_675239 [Mucidula mucida]
MSEAQRRRDYIRKFQAGELVNGFPLFYGATEHPPPADSIVNGRRTPTYMLCWKFLLDSDEIAKYQCFPWEIQSKIALPRWEELNYADQFGFEFLPRIQIVGPFFLIVLGVNLSDEYMASIMRLELIAAAKEAYDISDNLPSNRDLQWRRMEA